jgi:hypothetical protein
MDEYLTGGVDAIRVYDDRSASDADTERFMLDLRTSRGVEMASIRCPEPVLNGILDGGLAVVEGGRLRLTDTGFLVLNEVVLRLQNHDPGALR